MEEVERDIKNTRFIFDRNDLDIYDNLYEKSNEDLRALFSYIDFCDKNVLSVLASSDQVFYAYMSGAKNVDAFDKNKLTLYHYYLRLWFIKYLKQFHPDLSRNSIKLLLERVKPINESESNAYYYWNSIIKEFDDYMVNSFFIRSYNDFDVSEKELKIIENKVLDKELNFYNIDISQDNDIKKQYDILISSNIHDWISCSRISINNYANNLYKLLKDEGLVLISCFNDGSKSFSRNNLFRERFELVKMTRTNDSDMYGYVYKKKNTD